MRKSWNPSKSIDFIGGGSPFRGSGKIPMSNDDFEFTNEDDVGYHSPCISLHTYQGSTSPVVQGRSVREFKEQMATLRKENFNLKLRLFLIEETIPGYHQISQTSDGQETLMKKLIDNQVEMEILRKEVEEKHDLLQDAARAISHMEDLLKDTEIKHQEELHDVKQKLSYYEAKYELDKSQNMRDDFLGRSEMAENLSALQRIRELEDLQKESAEKLLDFQSQISALDDILFKRDETIREYEGKLKKLVFENHELLETAGSKNEDAAEIKRSIKNLHFANVQLKTENENLTKAIQICQEHFNKEITCIKSYETKICDQQDALTKMQSTLSTKTANTARLLERIMDYEKMVTKMNMERKLVKRENQFFRVIIAKLQTSYNPCYSFGEEEVCPKHSMSQTLKLTENLVDLRKIKMYEANCPESPKLQNDFQEDYKFKQKLNVNFCNAANCCRQQHHPSLESNISNVNFILPTNTISLLEKSSGPGGEQALETVVDDYLFQNYDTDVTPVRCSTISNTSLYSNSHALKPNDSCCSLAPHFSISNSLCCSNTRCSRLNNSPDNNCVVFYKVGISFK